MKNIRNIILSVLFILLLWPILYSVSYNDHLVYSHTIAKNEYQGEVIVNNGSFELVYRVKNSAENLVGVFRMKGFLLRFFPHRVLVYTTSFRPVIGRHNIEKHVWIRDYWMKGLVPVTLKGTRLYYYSVFAHRDIESYLQCRGEACQTISQLSSP